MTIIFSKEDLCRDNYHDVIYTLAVELRSFKLFWLLQTAAGCASSRAAVKLFISCFVHNGSLLAWLSPSLAA